ncbi:MAG: fibronectin type III domain-containing protein [Candidatus Eisenbacteria bacterium]|nr:fibronectin type III domain-containing protein [Candidatus Eisenbacteria bacterium]
MTRAGLLLIVLLAVTLMGAGCGNDTPVTPAPTDTEDLVAPAAPTGAAAYIRMDKLKVSWAPNSESDVVGYNVYWYDPAPETDETYIKLNTTPVTVTNFTEPGILSGVTYYVRVSAVDRSGNESRLSRPIVASPYPAPGDPGDSPDVDDPQLERP